MSTKKFPKLIASSRSSQNNNVRLGPGSRTSVKLRYSFQGGLVTPGKDVFNSPPNPPSQMDMDMLRTRGTRRPINGPDLGTMVERSAGHFQIPAELPQ